MVTNAKKKDIQRVGSGLRVKLLSMPRDGKANEELVETMADYFRIKRSDVKIIRGERDKRKILSMAIDEEQFQTCIEGIKEDK